MIAIDNGHLIEFDLEVTDASILSKERNALIKKYLILEKENRTVPIGKINSANETELVEIMKLVCLITGLLEDQEQLKAEYAFLREDFTEVFDEWISRNHLGYLHATVAHVEGAEIPSALEPHIKKTIELPEDTEDLYLRCEHTRHEKKCSSKSEEILFEKFSTLYNEGKYNAKMLKFSKKR
ncbi:MAG: hypothetical protein PHN72_02875 [Bacilli bacterium]|nr:hypothetical protein [Bacilli bacterium]